MIVVHASFWVKPDKRDDLLRVVRSMFAPTRAEAGCRSYAFLADVEDPDRFQVVEEWEDRAALDRHFRTRHILALLASLPKLLARPAEIQIHEVAATERR